MVTDGFTWIYKCDTVHIIVAWGGVYREKLDIDSAKLILHFKGVATSCNSSTLWLLQRPDS